MRFLRILNNHELFCVNHLFIQTQAQTPGVMEGVQHLGALIRAKLESGAPECRVDQMIGGLYAELVVQRVVSQP